MMITLITQSPSHLVLVWHLQHSIIPACICCFVACKCLYLNSIIIHPVPCCAAESPSAANLRCRSPTEPTYRSPNKGNIRYYCKWDSQEITLSGNVRPALELSHDSNWAPSCLPYIPCCRGHNLQCNSRRDGRAGPLQLLDHTGIKQDCPGPGMLQMFRDVDRASLQPLVGAFNILASTAQ